MFPAGNGRVKTRPYNVYCNRDVINVVPYN